MDNFRRLHNAWRSLPLWFLALSLTSAECAAAQGHRLPSPEAVGRMAPAIDSITEIFRQQQSLPGLAIAVTTTSGTVLYQRGYGFADVASRTAATSETVFRIYSISKVYAAALTHLLAEEGRLTLDAPIGRYLPELPAWRETVTVRQLLTHTSGLKDYTDVAGYEQSANAGGLDRDRFVALALLQPLHFPPGARWQYSNTGYVLIQRLIERTTSDSIMRVLAQRVLVPNALDATSPVCRTDAIATGYTPAWRLGLPGDSIVASEARNNNRYPLAVGGLCATPVDVARFFARLVGGSVVSAASLAEMTKRTPPGVAQSGAGLFVTEDNEGLILSHSGGGGNGNSDALAFPRDSLVLVALTNTGGADLEGLLRAVRRQVLYIPQPVVTDLPMTEQESTPLLGTYVYDDQQDRKIGVYARGGHLFAFGGRLLKQPDGSFVPEYYRERRLVFRIEKGVGAEVTQTAFGVVTARARRRP